MIRRITVIIALVCVLGPAAFVAQTAAQGAFTPEQYRKALWLATRFYGGQRMGELPHELNNNKPRPNWLAMDHTHPGGGFLKDALDGRDLTGGWFDCGDHVLFGQTFFYSVYALAKAYDVFPKAFHDDYDGTYYSNYVDKNDWSPAANKGNGIPDLLEELKFATDWIIKAVPDANTFYFQKSTGGSVDHSTWATPGFKSLMPNNRGGEREGSRTIHKLSQSSRDGVMPAFAAAGLAIMSKIYRKYDVDYAELCLKHAGYAYSIAKNNKGQAIGSVGGGFYPTPNESNRNSIFAIAAAEMYLATKNESYRNDIAINELNNHNWVFCYASPNDFAMHAISEALPNQSANVLGNMKTWFADRYSNNVTNSGDRGVANLGDNWGKLRYSAGGAYSAALYAQASGTTTHEAFIYRQVDYILGDNNAKQSFLIGFCEGCENEATKPHHRTVFLADLFNGNSEWGVPAGTHQENFVKNNLTIPQRNKYFGYMVGGTANSTEFKPNEEVESTGSGQGYKLSEGGVDYNVGLVGALAYIVSKLAPVQDVIQLSFSQDPNETASYINDSVYVDDLYENGNAKQIYAHILDAGGNPVEETDCNTMMWTYSTSEINIGAVPMPAAGCSFLTGESYLTSITVVYNFPGSDKPAISATIKVNAKLSVSHKTSAGAKGFGIAVKRGAVTFTAGQDRAISEISVYNIAGKKIFSQQKRSAPSAQVTWNTAKTAKGMYVARVKLNNGMVVQRNLMIK